jgi:nitrite reductase (NADH) large subunit
MSGRTSVVVGGGVAGIEAATAIRARDETARILVLTDEPWPYYSRIRIGEVVDGRSGPEGLFLRLDAWYDEQRIEMRRGARVEGIDPAGGELHVAGGERIPYDGLLLAVGARPFVPPFPGADLPAVTTLRRMDDALELRRRAGQGGRCVVVGGGLLGLELSASLAGAGMSVTVVEAAPWLLPRQVDAEGGAVLQGIMERRGVSFRLASGVEAVEPAEDGAVRVSVKGGERLPGDLVVVSAGVRPDTALARECGLAVDKGIRVDDGLRTSAPGIWAAGDCAEHRTGLYGFWSAGGDQGKAAGASLAGAPVAYAGSMRQTTLKITDVAVFSIGDLAAPFDREESFREGDVYRRVRMDAAGRVVGAVLIGSLDERKALVVSSMTGRPYRPA